MVTLGRTISTRAKAERSPTLRRVVWSVVGVFFISSLITGVWYVTRIQFFTIDSVVVQGGETIAHDHVREIVEHELDGTYFLLVPHRFSYTYPQQRIIDAVSRVPRIFNVSVTESNRKSLVVAFDEYVPHALWCATRETTAPCYFLTLGGYAFAEAPSLRGGSLIRHIREGDETLSTRTAFDESVLAAVHGFIMRMQEELSLRVTDVFYTKVGDIEFFVNGGGIIRITQTQDFVTSFENLVTLLHSEEFEHIEPGNFQYIDLRFGNKVFVNEQMQNEVATTTEDTASTSSLPTIE